MMNERSLDAKSIRIGGNTATTSIKKRKEDQDKG